MKNVKSKMKNEQLQIAIIHDWMIGGGAENVALELHRLFPDAPVFTSYCTDEWREKLDGVVVTGFLQKWPFPGLRKYVPFLRGWWFSSLDLKGYDLIISSSGAEAKFIKTKPPAVHISYIHAPTHYYWSRYDEYLKHPGFGIFDPLARLGLRILVGPMRRWDLKAAQRPDYLITNSNYTKNQIKKYYGRDSIVIHPPVDTERFSKLPTTNYQLSQNRNGFVIAGRQTPYKRFDLAVAACSKLGVSLTVIGNGPEHKKLMAMAGPNVTFLAKVTNQEMPAHFQKAEAFIFPGIDDFGIVAVEALAAGTPVIAYQDGGALDYVVPGKTGLVFNKQSASSLAEALERFASTKFDYRYIAKKATEYSTERFHEKLLTYIGTTKKLKGQ